MKKIFLTSGLVLCMACPAFATDITGTGNNGNECVESILGVDSGTASIEAKWEADSYKVIYAKGDHAAAGAVNVEYNNGVTYDSDYTVLAPSALTTQLTAADGYHFTTWNDGTADRATGYKYEPYQTAGNLTLTAQWAANQTTVKYACPNDASGTVPANGTATYGANFAFAVLPEEGGCAKEGYTFNGWSCTNLSGTQTAGGAGATWEYTGAHEGEITCTAVFGANSITLNWYNDSAATTPMVVQTAASTCTYDGAITLPDSEHQPSKTGYTFQGWKVRSNSNN